LEITTNNSKFRKVGYKKERKKLKQTNASAHIVQYMFKIREESSEGIRMTMAMDDSERIESPFYIRFPLLRSDFE